ncbi:MAG: TorF family putative porin, partial [Hyphomonadaceae bacterium]
MKKLLGVAAIATAATAAFAGTASAEGTFSGNVALTSDYVWRGISQSDSDIAIQGGFDYGNEVGGVPIYFGTWASSVDLGYDGTIELDVYGGIKPVLGPVTLEFGVIGYFYPGTDDGFDAEMVEFKAGASVAPFEGFSLTGNVYYSPDFTFTFDT